MRIDKAIEVLGLMGIDIKFWKDNEGQDAVNLGIEALKRVTAERNMEHPDLHFPLPGETKE